MIILSGGMTAKKAAQYPGTGRLMSPSRWQFPTVLIYACDNDAFKHSHIAGWWEETGEANWLAMLWKIPKEPRPLFVILPDVVGDWPATVARSRAYLPLLRQCGLPTALALQDGCDFEEAVDMETDAVFVGGSTAWKWNNVAKITRYFHERDKWVHVGRVNVNARSGPQLAYCLACGVDSVDGTEYAKRSNALLPVMSRIVRFWSTNKQGEKHGNPEEHYQ